MFLDIIHSLVLSINRPVYFSKQRFGDLILFPSSGKTYSVCVDIVTELPEGH
jgi:hypothetical protein